MNSIDNTAKLIVDSAFTVHTKLGPGLLESAYEACLAYELKKREIKVVQLQLHQHCLVSLLMELYR